MSTPSGVPWLAVLACSLAACNVPGARVHNLKELHEDTGRHALTAQILNGPEYYLRYGLADLFGSGLVKVREGEAQGIKNPLASCLTNASALARVESDDESVHADQVALFAWLAVDDPWHLTRETCVRALGPHGRRLEVEIQGAPPSAPAGVPEVRDALARLVAAVRQSGPGSTDALSGACEAIEALELERNGALRLLRGSSALSEAFSGGDPRAERLGKTVRRLESICVREALLAGLKDEPPADAGGSYPGWRNPRVRAAAVGACVEAFGESALAELLLQLDREPSVEVQCAVLRAVARRGLPEPSAELAAAAGDELQDRWIEALLTQAFDHPSGTVRVAAMRALARVAGRAHGSLREEDWQAWDRERRAARASAAEPATP